MNSLLCGIVSNECHFNARCYTSPVVCWLPVQGHAVQGHAVQGHAVQGHAVQGHAVADANCVSSTPLANGITLPGEVRLVADANCVSSTPLANGITLLGEVRLVACELR